MNESVAMIIVNYKRADLTIQCIDSLKKSYVTVTFIIVVENGSDDESVEIISKAHPETIFIENYENFGFARANNQGVELSLKLGAEYILIINNDTVADQNMLGYLLEKAKKYPFAAITPKIYFFNDPGILWFVYGKIIHAAGIFKNVAYLQYDTGQFDAIESMDFTVGCCVFSSSQIFKKTGGFDPSFFMYCEDLDWSLRMRNLGYKIMLEPRAKLWHHVSASGDKEPIIRRYFMTRNHLWTIRRHFTSEQKVFALMLAPVRSFYRIALLFHNSNIYPIKAEVKGLLDGLFRKI